MPSPRSPRRNIMIALETLKNSFDWPSRACGGISRPMRKSWLGFVFAIGILCLGGSASAAPTSAFVAQADQHWGMLKTYCVACHNSKLKNGGIAFVELDPAGVP